MDSNTVGLIAGGLVPAVLYGFSGVFAKASTKAGIGLGLYIFIVGLVITLLGAGWHLVSPERTISWRSGASAAGVGLTWGIGTILVALALSKYAVPLGKLVPLYNMNTLVAVLLALWIFSEWEEVKVPQLLIGSVLIIVGGTLVSRA